MKRERGFGEIFLSTLFTAKVGTFCHCIGGGGIRKGHFEVHINYNLNLSLDINFELLVSINPVV